MSRPCVSTWTRCAMRERSNAPGYTGTAWVVHAPDTAPSRSAWTIGYSPRSSRWNWERRCKHALAVPSAPDSNGLDGSRVRRAEPLRPTMLRRQRRRVTRWIEERNSPLRSSTGWGSTPNWLRNPNQWHRCRRTASRSSGGSESFGCTPAPYGIWRELTPRWVAPSTWDCCRVCSTTPLPPLDNPTHESTDYRPGWIRSSNQNCASPG